MRRVLPIAVLVSLTSIGLVARQVPLGPDAAVGSDEQVLASAIVFDSAGTFQPGQGFTTHVRLSWEGPSAIKSRVVYRETTAAGVPALAFLDAARSAFYNFAITSARVEPDASPAALPVALEYDVREAMSFGNGGRPWTFYVPVPRVMRRLPPADQLPVGEVGRWTARARYSLADGMFAAAPRGNRLETDFATYESRYSVDGRDLVVERTLQVKKLTLPRERERELQAFYLAVEDDRRRVFQMTPYPPGAATAADRLNEQGLEAFGGGDLVRAAEQFRQAMVAEPQHRWAAANLARVQLALKDAPAAIESSRRALAIDAAHAYARLTLGQALEAAGRFDEAERALTEQVERHPWSAWSLDSLARFLDGRGRRADAVLYWQRAVDAAPRDEPTVLALGSTLLGLGRSAEAVSTWKKGLEPTRNGLPYNSAAWALAERAVELDAARELLQRGIGLLARSAAAPTPEDPPRPAITQLFGALWDTAGWIEFKAARFDDAVAWLRAAWQHVEEPDVAERLGDALAAAKRPAEATRAYADALGREPGRASAAAKLAALPGAPAPDSNATEHALRQARTVSLQPGPAGAWTGDVDLAHDRTGAVVEIVNAGGAPAEVVDRLRSVHVPFLAPPDQRSYRLDRRVTVTCPGGNAACSALVWRPADVLKR